MNRRSANEDMKSLYPGGVRELLGLQQQEDNSAGIPELGDQSDYPVMAMKRKKQSSLLKSILEEGGYGDIAKQVSIRRP